ncbi:hypothetical protein [Shewanella surugensis]|uniref:Uncharacterized protein n=1 Tax=Shewanella surugensis TaxID=212020 RepID=A0ABT0L6J5_9GAMM|nr:hypothetical protein [Shewanella surugensis]MCL1123189.1 hypothetical protein [Shewanella surugensis]
MKNNDIFDALSKNFQSGDTPTEAHFSELISEAITLNVSQSIAETDIYHDNIAGVITENVMNLAELSSSLLNYDDATVELDDFLLLTAQLQPEDNGIYQLVGQLVEVESFIDITDKIIDINVLTDDEMSGNGLINGGYVKLNQQDEPTENGLYQYDEGGLTTVSYQQTDQHIEDVDHLPVALIAALALNPEDIVLITNELDNAILGLYHYQSTWIKHNEDYHLGYAIITHTEPSSLWFIYRFDNTSKASYWNQRLDVNAAQLLKGTINNARLPDSITGKAFSGSFDGIFNGNGASLTDLNADNIITGTLDNDRLPDTIEGKSFNGDGAGLTDLNADNITAGTISNDYLPDSIANKSFSGDGAGLTDLNADNITAGILNNAYLPGSITGKAFSGSFEGSFSGNGEDLTDLNASNVTMGMLQNEFLPTNITDKNFSGNGAGLTDLNADNITTGTMDNARLPADISVTSLSGNVSGDGAGLTDLNADNITTGTIDNARLPAAISVTSLSGNVSGDGAELTDLNANNITTGTLDNDRLPDTITGKSFNGDGAGLTNLNIEGATRATATDFGVMRFATEQEALEGTLTDVAITPATLALVTKKMTQPISPKKYTLLTDGSVTGAQQVGSVAAAFLYSDYVTTGNGKNLFITKAYLNNVLRIYEWSGGFSLIQTLNSNARNSYFRVINFGEQAILYAGDSAYLFDEQLNEFVFSGATGGNEHTKYGVAFDGKYRVAMLNSKTDTQVYEVENPLTPHVLTHPISIPFPAVTSDAITAETNLKAFSFDGSEEFGLIAYAQSFWDDPILVSRLAPNAASFTTVYSAQKPNGESHSGNALVYKDKTLVLHGNNNISSFGRMDTGTYQSFQTYSGGINGAELPVFSLKDNFYGVLPSSTGSLIYQVFTGTAVLKATVPGASTSSQSIGLAIFDGDIFLINGNTLIVHKLIIS